MKLKKIQYYKCKSGLLPGHRYADVAKVARKIFKEIKTGSKRRPYIRSAYFRGEKIFLDNFWVHLSQKVLSDRVRRLKYFGCAIELIKKSKNKPIYKIKNNYKDEIFYRFIGMVNHQYFAVQIKEDLKRKQKFLMSVFDYKIK